MQPILEQIQNYHNNWKQHFYGCLPSEFHFKYCITSYEGEVVRISIEMLK